MRNALGAVAVSFLVVPSLQAQAVHWIFPYDGPGSYADEALALAYGKDGVVYAAGYAGAGTNSAGATVAAIDLNGSPLWVFSDAGPGGAGGQAEAIVYGDDGNLYLAGTSMESPNPSSAVGENIG